MNKGSQRRQFGLDGMRALAALAVFGIHLWIYQLPNTLDLQRDSIWKTLLFEGRVAFVLFFVLSGYLLYRPFARAALGGGAPVPTGSYLLRRAARIMPAYYLALAGGLLLTATAGDGVPGRRMVDAARLPLFLVFGQNYSSDTLLMVNAATWTLAVEVAFYLILPVVALVALRKLYGNVRGQAILLAFVALAGIAWNVIGGAAGWGAVAGHAPPSFLAYFALGMLAALLVERRRLRSLAAWGGRVTALVVGVALVTLVLNGYWHATDRSPDGFLIQTLADLPAAVAFAALVCATAVGTGAGLGWLGWRPLAWLGQVSYGFYLWHIPLIVWARGHGLLSGPGVVDVAVLLPVVIAVGAASWYLVELPLMRRAAQRAIARGQADEKPAPGFQRSQARTIALANPRP